jgi:hypothetical protein
LLAKTTAHFATATPREQAGLTFRLVFCSAGILPPQIYGCSFSNMGSMIEMFRHAFFAVAEIFSGGGYICPSNLSNRG